MKSLKDFLLWATSDDGSRRIDNGLQTIGLIILVFAIWFNNQMVCAGYTKALYHIIKENPEIILGTSTVIDFVDNINIDSELLMNNTQETIERQKNLTNNEPLIIQDDFPEFD